MIWLATIAAAIALAHSARSDVTSTREATDAGALEAHWLYRLAGGHWDTLRWAVCAVAIGLMVWAVAGGDPLAGWVAVAFAFGWSAYVWQVAARNRRVAAEMRARRENLSLPANATRGAGPDTQAGKIGGRG